MAPRTEEQFEKIRQERKNAILDAAVHVFAEEGFHSATMAMVAKKAGISKGLIYNYFQNKEELVRYLMITLVDDVLSDFGLEETMEMTREDFIRMIDKSFELVLNDTQKWKLYTTIMMQPEVMALVMGEMMQKMQPYLEMGVKYFAAKGHSNPYVMFRYFSAVMDGVQFHVMLDKENFPAEEVKKMLIEQFV